MASTEEVLVWTPELEVSLFHSMKGHKPVGINRHFHMACIHDKFATSTGKRNISSKQIWEHLQELYNLQALDDLENLPFPNDETEFNLPDEIFESNAKPHSSASESSAVADEGMTGLASNSPNASTPDSSPKRKRTRQVNSASSSQPSSPHPPSSAKRRR
ncbi:MRG/MORF4L-binding protein isoform X2 [Pocillopora verrucosa]|uniref:MRG/MORF4L-binding protein-like isoform X2 n=1 Tax=Pocillopora damicornis TaxID=46731 RepID=UPI000F556DA6|nr:MRG/MORF4L-binding protein-like isoform X2 [Pocillopora damicornis]XP_058952735.1 MRG/MORF4L-binding protein-like isoform X2 [Pocillopora verrucosa]